MITASTASRSNRFLDTSVSDFLWVLGFLALAFEIYLRDLLSIFNYIDEAATLLFLLLATIKTMSRHDAATHLLHKEKVALLLFSAFLFIGMIGNLFSGVDCSVLACGIDLFACSKFCIALLSAIIVFGDDRKRLINMLLCISRCIVLILFICAVMNLFVDIGMSSTGYRYGIRSFSFVFYHPTCVNALCVGLIGLLCIDISRNKFYIVLASLVMCLTLRIKGVAFAAVALVLLLFTNKTNKLSFPMIVASVLTALLIGYDQFSNYYANSEEARLQLTTASLAVAADFFPIGAGFATFASNVTAIPAYYSDLYYAYGLSTVWGLSPNDPRFISDTFLPILFGQFGWLGLICFVVFIIELSRGILERARINGASILPIIMIMAYLLISSTSESSFFSHSSVFFAMCLALCISPGAVSQR